MEEWLSWAERDLPSFLSPSSSTSSDNPPSSPTSRSAVLAYLFSATFKDCSLILRLPLPSSPSSSSSDSPIPPALRPPHSFLKAIDLDPKPINRLGKYWRMDQEIVASWREMLEGLREEERAAARRCME